MTRTCLCRNLLTGLAMLAAAVSPTHRALAQADLAAAESILRALPADARAALVVPNLKRASDDLTRLMEGMDRANIMLGSRPIDQFKAITGLIGGVDDLGGGAIVWLNGAGDEVAAPPSIAYLVPVSEPQAFLSSNFTRESGDEPDAHRRDDETIFYARTIDSHVLLGRDAGAVRTYRPAGRLDQALGRALQQSAGVFTSGEIVLLARGEAASQIAEDAISEMGRRGLTAPALAELVRSLAHDAELIAIGFDCDPLALIARGIVQFKRGDAVPTGEAVAAQRAGIAKGTGLANLSNEPYAFALSVDLAALRGAEVMERVRGGGGEGGAAIAGWLAQVEAFQFAAAPSPAGAAGGLLNQGVLMLEARDPGALRETLRRELLDKANSPLPREAAWNDAQPLPGGETADQWSAGLTELSPERAHLAALERLLFGAAGARGYVRVAPNGLLVTFSQRPAVLEKLTRSVREAAASSAIDRAGFAGNPAVRTMRRWLPAQRDIEAYVHAGPMRAMLVEQLQHWPAAGPLVAAIPEFGANLPPIGAAAALSPSHIDGAMVIPAGVLTPLFDELARRLPARQPERR